MIDVVVYRKRHTQRMIEKVPTLRLPTALKDVHETLQVRPWEKRDSEKWSDCIAISEVHPDKAEGLKLFKHTKARFLQRGIIIVIDDVETNDLPTQADARRENL